MQREPICNDPRHPLVSILLYDYYGEHLGACFNSIFEQTALDNIEVIFIDNASTDHGWEQAIGYADKFPGAITLKRNKRSGENDNLRHGLRLAKGKYFVPLCRDDAFRPEYVKRCIQVMESDPFATFDLVQRLGANHRIRPSVTGRPLVSVLVHNFNYGRYLRQCLQSVVQQTYPNIEVVFSDNASTDESWKIACEYALRYPGLMTIIRHRKNFGPANNLSICYTCASGKYFSILCSDDALRPDFIERCVSALEAHPDAGFVMTHRSIIDEQGAASEEPAFYNRSCIIPGSEQAAVYMMAAFDHLPSESVVSRWYAQRILDFNLCCQHSMAYIKDPLLLHRVHSASDSSQIAMNVMEAFGQFILPHLFVEMAARQDHMDKCIGRLPQALEKLGSLCLRYCTRALSIQDEVCALRYFHLSIAILPAIRQDPVFQRLSGYWTADRAEKARIVESLTATANLASRSVSYDPPPGSAPIREKTRQGV
jgi:glycosyltransferase involved in cell wall biosynthesis